MAEVNADLVQQLEQNLASFKRAGLEEDVEAIEAKLAAVGGGKAEAVEAAEDEEFGTGPYEGRTVAQLRALAASRGLPTGGTKDELAETLREG